MILPERATRRRLALLTLALFWFDGCDARPITPNGPTSVESPPAVQPGPEVSKTFEPGKEIPPDSFAFEGGPGYVRVTVEAERSGGGAATASLNDVLFSARGGGRIVVSFRKPWPGHDEGRVTVRCEGGSEDSSAEFEPSLWFRDPTAAVARSSPGSGSIGLVVAGREIVLARYAAKVGAEAVGLTLKATFSAEPMAVRVQAKAEGR